MASSREIASYALTMLPCAVCGVSPGTRCPEDARESWQAVCMARFGVAAVTLRRQAQEAACQLCHGADGDLVRIRWTGAREWHRVRLCAACTEPARADERVEVATLSLVATGTAA